MDVQKLQATVTDIHNRFSPYAPANATFPQPPRYLPANHPNAVFEMMMWPSQKWESKLDLSALPINVPSHVILEANPRFASVKTGYVAFPADWKSAEGAAAYAASYYLRNFFEPRWRSARSAVWLERKYLAQDDHARHHYGEAIGVIDQLDRAAGWFAVKKIAGDRQFGSLQDEYLAAVADKNLQANVRHAVKFANVASDRGAKIEDVLRGLPWLEWIAQHASSEFSEGAPGLDKEGLEATVRGLRTNLNDRQASVNLLWERKAGQVIQWSTAQTAVDETYAALLPYYAGTVGSTVLLLPYAPHDHVTGLEHGVEVDGTVFPSFVSTKTYAPRRWELRKSPPKALLALGGIRFPEDANPVNARLYSALALTEHFRHMAEPLWYYAQARLETDRELVTDKRPKSKRKVVSGKGTQPIESMLSRIDANNDFIEAVVGVNLANRTASWFVARVLDPGNFVTFAEEYLSHYKDGFVFDGDPETGAYRYESGAQNIADVLATTTDATIEDAFIPTKWMEVLAKATEAGPIDRLDKRYVAKATEEMQARMKALEKTPFTLDFQP